MYLTLWYRRSKGRRMEASREKSGSRLLAISVIGRTTAKMGSVFSFTRMETSTKACGREIGDMARERTGETRLES